MPILLADTVSAMGDFPVAEANGVDIDINGTHKDLQTAYEDGDLGGGGSSVQVDTMPLASAENEGKIVEYVGASGTYTNGYFYKCVEDSGSYSWVQHNVQPSNATANDVSYDNTISELDATNVQDAIDEVVSGLGTASGKDFTDEVRPNSHDLVESIAVYSAINNALNTIYVPRGDLSCAELTSALLIADNVGNVYQMSDSGYTSSLFINGAGITINKDDNVGIIKAGADEIMFNYMGSAFDLHDYQKKDLTTAVEGQTTVEGALGLLEYKSGAFPGTLEEWDALPASEKAKYDFIATPDEAVEDIADAVIDGDMRAITSNAVFGILPIGVILPYGGSTAPENYLICNGSAVSRTTYASLFAVIGTSFGAGDGSTTFNLPDMREAVPKGAGLTGKSNNHYDSDGLSVGEFIDDRLQDFRDGSKWRDFAPSDAAGWNFLVKSASGTTVTGRFGATTEVKSVGVNYIIKYA